MSNLPLLSAIIFLPLVGSLFIFAMKGQESTIASNARNVAIWTSFLTFALSIILWINFDVSQISYQFVERNHGVLSLDLQSEFTKFSMKFKTIEK